MKIREELPWASYRGGYNRIQYDVRPLIRRLQDEGTTDEFWSEVWNELYHQGDVGEATYAIIPFLVDSLRHSDRIDSQLVAFAVYVELDRRREGNPDVPAELASEYLAAVAALPQILATHADQEWDEYLVMFHAAAVAVRHGQYSLARAYLELTPDEAEDFLVRFFGADGGSIAPPN
jgi:hypothetical protein